MPLVRTRCPNCYFEAAIAAYFEHSGTIAGQIFWGAIPIFRIQHSSQNRLFRNTSTRIGWRILITTQTEEFAAVDVRNREKSIQVQRIFPHAKCGQSIEGANIAERLFGSSRLSYQPRILKLPGRVPDILWLRCKSGGMDRFVTLGDRLPSRKITTMLRTHFGRITIHRQF
jgi:hypothetical protein